jgi:hypothetical protein
VEELNNGGLNSLCHFYNNVVRNGIAHGGLSYRHNTIVFRGKKGSPEELPLTEIVYLVDDLLDVCNGIALAIKIFFLSKKLKNFQLPRQMMMEELQAQTEAPWWKIEGSVESKVIQGNQLIIFCKVATNDFMKVHYSTVTTGIISEQLSPGYDRYFLSLTGYSKYPGFAALKGNILRKGSRKTPFSFSNYTGVLEDDLLFFKPRLRLPKLFHKIETYYISFKIRWKLVKLHFSEVTGPLQPNIRNTSIHRNGWRSIVRGAVVVDTSKIDDVREVILNMSKKNIRKSIRKARKTKSRFNILRYIPVGFVRLSIFTKDQRVRQLSRIGLGPELICTIEIRRIKRIQTPDIFGSTIEERGRIRIAWNKSWLELCK